ncbi:hypothetical protein [Guptibacillus algicola]|uniref:hypothetical protein n=1 Tax=Guptibacillus algicola TaxID=225844 RepID=UPI001CD6B533|nr:hypothetical protein [Alkalihalobacillus algicola]MCA0987185.1 hypothetical protein [Alkalihalobacillus algicola]
MLSVIMSIVLMVFLIVSIFIVIKKRKKAGQTGLKSALTPICFFAISIINLFGIWFHSLGVVIWSLNVVLLIMGAYFTKYSLVAEKHNS